MKLRPRSWQIFWDAHAWAGAVAAPVLTVMFFAGVPALYRDELAAWQEPRPAAAAAAAGGWPALQGAFERRARAGAFAGGRRAGVRLADGRGLLLEWDDAAGERRVESVDRATGAAAPPGSRLADFLYALHFLDVVPYGLYVAGLAAVALGLALATGVLIHLKDLVRQAFQFRPARRARTWAGDAHKVLGVFGLPFQVLFAWSGAVLCLGYVTVQPALVATVFRGDVAAAQAARGELPDPPAAAGRPGPLPELGAFVARARARVPGLRPTYLSVHQVGDEASTVDVFGDLEAPPFAYGQVRYAARDGVELAADDGSAAAPVVRFERWLFGLHFAHFGGGAIKALYALLALATGAVLVTGNLVWLERRDRARAHPGNRLLERLTVGVAAGLPLATAALFAANRLLPANVGRRATVEQALFWATWLVALAAPFVTRAARPTAGASLAAAGALFALAATADAAKRGATAAGRAGAGVDVGLALAAVACAVGGTKLARRAASRDGESAGRGAKRGPAGIGTEGNEEELQP